MRNRDGAEKQYMQVTSNFWLDLCYHALGHLPVGSADASSLFSPSYVSWMEGLYEGFQTEDRTVPRTLVKDAALLGRLYADSGRGWLLQSFPLLWEDEKSFLAEMMTPFEQINWPTPEQARLASVMRESLPLTLVELFRTAQWAEVKNGFKTIWEHQVVPRIRAYTPRFMAEMGKLSEVLPGLGQIQWYLCYPLGAHGRGLTRGSGERIILAGVADPMLGVSQTHPMMQACHEYFVLRAAEAMPRKQEYATCPGLPGYEAFQAVETEALRLSAEFFRHSQWDGDYREWRKRVGAPWSD